LGKPKLEKDLYRRLSAGNRSPAWEETILRTWRKPLRELDERKRRSWFEKKTEEAIDLLLKESLRRKKPPRLQVKER